MQQSGGHPARPSTSSQDTSFTSSSRRTSDEHTADSPTKRTRDKLKSWGQKAKIKTKDALHIDDTHDRVKLENPGVIDELENNPAFKPEKAASSDPVSAVADTIDGTASKGRRLLHLAAHPRKSLKHKTAKKLATSDRPYTSRQAEEKLLKAHDELEAVQEDLEDGEESEKVDRLRGVIDDMEDHRESLRIAWTSRRFIHRVRVVPVRQRKLPKPIEYQREEGPGVYRGIDWFTWYGHFLLYICQDVTTQYMDDFEEPPYDRDIMTRHFERLVIASAPWQDWWMSMRKVQRWENPAKTAGWLAFFLLLWYTDHVFTFIWSWVPFTVLRYRYTSISRESLRESYERAADTSQTAQKMSEIIDRHGRGDWLEAFIDAIGPTLQMQLADTADFLEILDNFYRWKYPRKTMETLFFWFTLVLYTGVTPLSFDFRIVTLATILIFFCSRPIGSRYPKYRHLVSPLRWIWWDVPTNAEWTFQYLQQRARITRIKMLSHTMGQQKAEDAMPHAFSNPAHLANSKQARPDTHTEYSDQEDDDDDAGYETASSSLSAYNVLKRVDIISFKGSFGGARGRLVIQSDGMRFMRSVPRKQLWYRQYSELLEMRKIDGTGIAKMRQQSMLEFEYVDGNVEQVDAMKQRDEAFNTIIGFSALRWQQLQPLVKEAGHRMGPGTVVQTEDETREQQARVMDS